MNVSPSANSSARLPTGLPTPWPARPSWLRTTGLRSTARRRGLQAGHHLAGVERIDSTVTLGRLDQRRRVARPVDDVVVGRVGVQPGELLGDVGIAVFGRPQAGDAELWKADHVEQRHSAPHRPAQVGALGERGADEQATVGAAMDGEALAARQALGDEVVGGRLEVVEHVLLVGTVAGEVPLLTVLPTAAQAGDGAQSPPAAHHAAAWATNTGDFVIANPP